MQTSQIFGTRSDGKSAIVKGFINKAFLKFSTPMTVKLLKSSCIKASGGRLLPDVLIDSLESLVCEAVDKYVCTVDLFNETNSKTDKLLSELALLNLLIDKILQEPSYFELQSSHISKLEHHKVCIAVATLMTNFKDETTGILVVLRLYSSDALMQEMESVSTKLDLVTQEKYNKEALDTLRQLGNEGCQSMIIEGLAYLNTLATTSSNGDVTTLVNQIKSMYEEISVIRALADVLFTEVNKSIDKYEVELLLKIKELVQVSTSRIQ